MKFIEIETQIEFYSIDKLKQKLKHYKRAIERYAFVVHDKDHNKDGSPKPAHFHCDIEFKSKTYTFERIAKMFEIDKKFLQKPKKKGVIGFNSCLSYLIHDQDTTGKHKYGFDEVVSNFDYKAIIEEIRKQVEEVETVKVKRSSALTLIDKYANFELTRKQLLESLTFSEFHDNQKRINNASRWRNEKSRNGEREMKVIYIYGSSGSGKTTLAKFLALSLGFDYFVSGSGKDFLDGYDNEEVIILDDFRSELLSKSELFKMLDNNTGSAVKSRYFNKVINHCRILIITTVRKPYNLYCWMDDDEPSKQFVRRLGYNYLAIDDNGIIWTVGLNDEAQDTNREVFKDFNMSQVFTLLSIQESKTGLGSILNTVSKKVREKLEQEAKTLPF